VQLGEAPAITFGIGFALNDRAALTLSYQQEHVFTAYEDGQPIKGSPYSFSTFNFWAWIPDLAVDEAQFEHWDRHRPKHPVAQVLFELPHSSLCDRESARARLAVAATVNPTWPGLFNPVYPSLAYHRNCEVAEVSRFITVEATPCD
jgi:hypothetical protein